MQDSAMETYHGDGRRANQPLPPFENLVRFDSPEGYLADDGLREAVNVALMLGQPLLLTGEPGTGKSLLAHSVAYELQAGVPDERGRLGPLVFHCKTTSTASDLFYRYDALRRFHDANRRDADLPSPDSYITYEALGLAILLALPPEKSNPYLPERFRGLGPRRCVVLADEIDKAPRDLPNDVLNEIERMTFTVKETGRTFAADEAYKPILILTSNSERDLPDAFLRRCAFYHVPFPDKDRLAEILASRLNRHRNGSETGLYEKVVALFEEMRNVPGLRKKPATAELIAWTRLLLSAGVTAQEIEQKNAARLLPTLALLAKTPEDRDKLTDWLKPRR